MVVPCLLMNGGINEHIVAISIISIYKDAPKPIIHEQLCQPSAGVLRDVAKRSLPTAELLLLAMKGAFACYPSAC